MRRRRAAYLVVTEGGSMVVLTSRPAIDDARALGALERRGVDRFIAWELPLEVVRRAYGAACDVILGELAQGTEMRVLDFNGPHIFANVPLSRLGRQVRHEQPRAS
jgi:hypothetical protein